MAVSLSTIAAIAGRSGNQYVEDQINLKSALLGQKVLEKENVEGQVRVVNVMANGIGSVSIMTGGAAYPTAESNAPTQLMVKPVSFVGHVSIPFDAAKLVSGKKESINLVKRHFEILGKNLAQNLGRELLDGYLGAVEATAAISGTSTATISVSDITGFRNNQIVDIYATGPGSKTHTCRVVSVTRDGDGTGSVAVSEVKNGSGSAETSGNINASDGVWVQGHLAPAAGYRFTSLADACGSADLYGVTVSDTDWSGNDTNLAGALSLEAMREAWFDIQSRSGDAPTHTVMHPLAFQDFEALQLTYRQILSGEKMDVHGKNALQPEFSGRPVVIDDNCPGKSVFFLNDSCLKLGVWGDFDGFGNGSNGVEVSQTNYSFLIKVGGMFNQIVERRNALGRLKNITIG